MKKSLSLLFCFLVLGFGVSEAHITNDKHHGYRNVPPMPLRAISYHPPHPPLNMININYNNYPYYPNNCCYPYGYRYNGRLGVSFHIGI